MSDRFYFSPDIPQEIIPAVEELILPIEWLLPRWCQRCAVHWWTDTSDKDLKEGALASCICAYEYRQVKIFIYPALLDNTKDRRSEVLMHELIHAHVNVLFNFAHDELNELVPEADNPKHNATLKKELVNRVESVVQDLTWCLLNQPTQSNGSS